MTEPTVQSPGAGHDKAPAHDPPGEPTRAPVDPHDPRDHRDHRDRHGGGDLRDRRGGGDRMAVVLRVAIVLTCGLLGFLLVAHVRTVEDFDQRLALEREEDLTLILSNLSDQSDELTRQILERRLLLAEFEVNSEREQLAVNSLRDRLDDLKVLTGSTVVVGDEGIRLVIEDPDGNVGQDQMVDVVQELRDAGAEAVAINDVRLIAQSAIATRNQQLVLDGQLIAPPYRVEAIGDAEALSRGLAIPGGVESALRAKEQVSVNVQSLAGLTLPARVPAPFVFAEPVPEVESTE